MNEKRLKDSKNSKDLKVFDSLRGSSSSEEEEEKLAEEVSELSLTTTKRTRSIYKRKSDVETETIL